MKTFEDLKSEITPEFIKKLCELAEGFVYTDDNYAIYNNTYDTDNDLFPLFLHRAVEGIWKTRKDITLFIHSDGVYLSQNNIDLKFQFGLYEPCHLTACEMEYLIVCWRF